MAQGIGWTTNARRGAAPGIIQSRSRSESQTCGTASTGARLPDWQHFQNIAAYLHEPVTRLRHIFRCYKRHQKYLATIRDKRQSPVMLQQIAESFDFPQHESYSQLLKLDTRSRIIVSAHTGNYIFLPALLASIEPPCRQQFVLSLSAASEACVENLKGAFPAVRANLQSQLLVSNANPLVLARILRRNRTTLYTFGDLPPQFGESAHVEFLGRSAVFPRGPASLAVACRIPILPIVPVLVDGRCQVLAAPQLEPEQFSGRDCQAAARAITQILVRFFESVLQQYPEQWRYLPCLPQYFAMAPD